MRSVLFYVINQIKYFWKHEIIHVGRGVFDEMLNKAVVRFSQPDPDVSIISGLFTQTQPDYPDAELLEQETESSAE